MLVQYDDDMSQYWTPGIQRFLCSNYAAFFRVRAKVSAFGPFGAKALLQNLAGVHSVTNHTQRSVALTAKNELLSK